MSKLTERRKQHYTLLTGATGLVGRYLLKDFLSENIRLAVVVRNSRKAAAAARIDRICEFWERQLQRALPRPVCLTGDIRLENMGLSTEDAQWVDSNCGTCFHNAAILKFCSAPRDQEPWVTNLDGTRNLIHFCEKMGISDFHYVSTAYVCGDRNDLIQEGELNCGQEFRNDYEYSKFLGEQLVQESTHLKKKTIYRPAIITADSKTGYTTTYHGLHLYLRLMSLLVPQVKQDANGIRQTKISLPMTGEEKRNIVTVDWVSKVMTELFLNENAHGHTFHLSPTSKLTPKAIIDYCCEYFASGGVEFVGNKRGVTENQSTFEENFLGNVGVYSSYDRSDPSFDTENLKRFAGHIPCPEIDKQTVHRFLKFGEADRWGKKKETETVAEFPVNQHTDQLKRLAVELNGLLSENSSQENGASELGFDVVGVGGGQWCYDSKGDHLLRGLPADPNSSVVRIRSKTLWQILSDRMSTTRDELAKDHDVLGTLGDYRSLISFVDAETYH